MVREVAQSHISSENWDQVQNSGLFKIKTITLKSQVPNKGSGALPHGLIPSGAPFLSHMWNFLLVSLVSCSFSFLFPHVSPPPSTTAILMCSFLPEAYLLRDGKSDDNLIFEDVPTHHR